MAAVLIGVQTSTQKTFVIARLVTPPGEPLEVDETMIAGFLAGQARAHGITLTDVTLHLVNGLTPEDSLDLYDRFPGDRFPAAFIEKATREMNKFAGPTAHYVSHRRPGDLGEDKERN